MNIFSKYFKKVWIISMFSLTAISWTSPLTISGNGTNTTPSVSVNNQGKASVVWNNGIFPQLSIQSSSYDGTNWSAVTTISDIRTSVSPVCGIDSSGNSVAAWEVLSGRTRSILTAQKPAGQNWNLPITLSIARSNTGVSIATNAFGQTIVGWINKTNNIIQTASLNFGGSWSSISAVQLPLGSRGDLKLGIDNSGNGILAWEDYTAAKVFTSQTTAGLNSSWSNPRLVNAVGKQKNPTLSVNALGNAIVSWINKETNLAEASIYSNSNWLPVAILSDSVSSTTSTAISESEYFVSWVNLVNGNIEGISTINGIWDIAFNLSAMSSNLSPRSSYCQGTFYTLWADLIIEAVNVADYLTPSPVGGSSQPPFIISNGNSNTSAIISSSLNNTIIAWESIIGKNNSVIQVNMN